MQAQSCCSEELAGWKISLFDQGKLCADFPPSGATSALPTISLRWTLSSPLNSHSKQDEVFMQLFRTFLWTPKPLAPLQCRHKCSFLLPFVSLRVHLTYSTARALTSDYKDGMQCLLAPIVPIYNLPRLCRCSKGSGMPRTYSASRRAASDRQHLCSLPFFAASKYSCISHGWG